MKPRIVDRERIVLAGFSFFGDPFAESRGCTQENEIGRLWNRLFTYLTDHRGSLPQGADDSLAYEVHVECDETASKGYREVFVGIEVGTLDEIPVELLVKALPPSQYVVFTLQGEHIASDWSRMISDWMAANGYTAAHRYGFQLYDRRFKGLDNLEASELDVYLPIRPLNEGSDSCDS
jgi:predicted transcriptional regulator YdeE